MAERKPAKKSTQKSAKSTTAVNKKSTGFTDEERAAMKERAQELKAEARRGPRADKANLDEGAMWPTAYALTELTAAQEAMIAALVKKGGGVRVPAVGLEREAPSDRG
jgi:hypothetical protein